MLALSVKSFAAARTSLLALSVKSFAAARTLLLASAISPAMSGMSTRTTTAESSFSVPSAAVWTVCPKERSTARHDATVPPSFLQTFLSAAFDSDTVGFVGITSPSSAFCHPASPPPPPPLLPPAPPDASPALYPQAYPRWAMYVGDWSMPPCMPHPNASQS